MNGLLREIKNFVASLTAVIVIVLLFLWCNRSGLTYELANQIVQLRIRFGLLPSYYDPNKGILPPILQINFTIFIVLTLVCSSLFLKFVRRTESKFRILVYGLSMPTFFWLVTQIYTLISADKAGGAFSVIGTTMISLVILPLIGLHRNDSKSGAHHDII